MRNIIVLALGLIALLVMVGGAQASFKSFPCALGTLQIDLPFDVTLNNDMSSSASLQLFSGSVHMVGINLINLTGFGTSKDYLYKQWLEDNDTSYQTGVHEMRTDEGREMWIATEFFKRELNSYYAFIDYADKGYVIVIDTIPSKYNGEQTISISPQEFQHIAESFTES